MRRRLSGLILFALIATLSAAAGTLPRQIADDAFWRMISDFSEKGGVFRFQLMSNEREFPSVIPALKKTASAGGVYLGVGTEQNFTYIAAIHPELAFVFDIRRENMIEHLIYKAIFEMSANRTEFISRLFSRKAPPGTNEKSTAAELFQAYVRSEPDPQMFRQNLQAIRNRLIREHRFPLTPDDQMIIDSIYRLFFETGPGINYTFRGFGGFRPGTYAGLMTATDENKNAWSYLATEENFQTVREMERKNLIVPLVGDFAGTKAIRTVGKYLKDHDAVVSVFYTSNVEQYLFEQADDWRHFYSNVATLPVNPSSTFVRSSHFGYGAAAQRQRQNPSIYVMLRSPLLDVVRAFNGGRIQNYDQLIRLSKD